MDRARPVAAVAALAAAVFACRGDEPPAERRDPASSRIGDEAGRAAAPPPAPTPPPTPEGRPRLGMVLVRHTDGVPWFFVDAAPMTHGDYAKIYPDRKQPSPELDGRPVVDVSYPQAKEAATEARARLILPVEYDAALKTEGFVPPPAGTWEWIETAQPEASDQQVRSGRRSATRPAGGGPDVTFRTVVDVVR